MGHYEATRVVPLPLNQVEVRLRDIESWSTFLEGVGSIRFVSHERYVFTLNDGRDHRELKMVVRLRYSDHSFVWHGLGGAHGSVLRGSLKLERTDDRRTAVTLSMFSYPADFRSGVAELLMPVNDRAVVDLKLLEDFLTLGAEGSLESEQSRSPDAEAVALGPLEPRERLEGVNHTVPEQVSTHRRFLLGLRPQ